MGSAQVIHSPIFYEGYWMLLIRRIQENNSLCKTKLQPRRLRLFSSLGELLWNKTEQLHHCQGEKQPKLINVQVKGKKGRDDKRWTVTQKAKVQENEHRVQRQTKNSMYTERK